MWRLEYAANLRETQHTSELNINSLKINVHDIMLFFTKRFPETFGGLP